MIPAFEEGAWCLPDGIHATTLDEIEERFVVAAPFSDQRRIVFDAFKVWYAIVSPHLTGARFWIDGGFVTHKPWAAPSDVDVTVMAKTSDVNALPVEVQDRIFGLLTERTATGKVQPMSGMVDAFLFARGDVDTTVGWINDWKTVLDENRDPIPNMVKGFLEVRP